MNGSKTSSEGTSSQLQERSVSNFSMKVVPIWLKRRENLQIKDEEGKEFLYSDLQTFLDLNNDVVIEFSKALEDVPV